MNTITHTEVLPFIQNVDQLVADFLADEGEELSATGMVLAVIETVADNADEWIESIELAITRQGYVVKYEPIAGTGASNDLVLDLLERGLEVQRESLYEN